MDPKLTDALGYRLTWACYGRRLRGDDRGTVDNTETRCGAPVLDHNPERRRFARAKMTGDPVTLDLAMRRVVAAAVEEVCTHRRWPLLALNVRTAHVHVVLSCAGPPERPLAPFKAWSTRRWREAGLVAADRKLWAHHGSKRSLWKPEGLEGAIVSVRDLQ